MGVANTKSTSITNADTQAPRPLSKSYIEHSQLRVCVGTVEIAAADDDTSVYRLCRIPSGARVHKIEILSDAITGGTVFDVGIYKRADDGGAVITADLFASNLDLSQGNTIPREITFEALDIASIESRLWELASLSTDPFLEYDICLTGDTVGSGAGTVSARVYYVL